MFHGNVYHNDTCIFCSNSAIFHVMLADDSTYRWGIVEICSMIFVMYVIQKKSKRLSCTVKRMCEKFPHPNMLISRADN